MAGTGEDEDEPTKSTATEVVVATSAQCRLHRCVARSVLASAKLRTRRGGLAARAAAPGQGRRGRAGVSAVTLADLERTRRRPEAARACRRRGRKGESQGEAEGADVRGAVAVVQLAAQAGGAAAVAGWPVRGWMGEEPPGRIRGGREQVGLD